MYRYVPCLLITALLGITNTVIASNPSLTEPSSSGEIPVTTSSEVARTAFLQARDALEMTRSADAEALLNQAIEQDPTFALAYLYKAYLFTSLADWRKNMDLAVANKDRCSPGEQLLIDMRMTYPVNDAAKRFALTRKLVNAYPGSARALLILADQIIQRRDVTKARDLMRQALEIAPDFVPAHNALSVSYMTDQPQNLTIAADHARQMIKHRPDEPIGHIALGDIYRAENKLEASRTSYVNATEINPRDDRAFGKKGHINTFLGNYDQAREDYRIAQQIAKGNLKVVWANYGVFTFLYAGDVTSALDAWNRLLTDLLQMNLSDPQLLRARINVLGNRTTAAMHYGLLSIAEHALKERTEYQLQRFDTLQSANMKRNFQTGQAIWEGTLAAYQGDYTKAIERAEHNARLQEPSSNPRKLDRYHRLRGDIHLMQKQYDLAIEHYQKASNNSIRVQYGLALSHQGAGNHEASQRLLKQIAGYNFNTLQYALIRAHAIERTR